MTDVRGERLQVTCRKLGIVFKTIGFWEKNGRYPSRWVVTGVSVSEEDAPRLQEYLRAREEEKNRPKKTQDPDVATAKQLGMPVREYRLLSEEEKKSRLAEAEEKKKSAREERLLAGLSTEWKDYLKEHGFVSYIGRLVAEVCDNPAEADTDWFREAMDAVCSNRDHRGELWRVMQEEGMSHDILRGMIKAYRRHANTNYDDLLRAGVERDVARELKEEV